MIKKLDKNLASNINSCNMSQNIMVAHKAIEKINELVDAVNELHEEAKNNVRIRANHDTLIDSLIIQNNIHEKQIDELQMKVNKMEQNLNFTQPEVKDKFAEQRKWIGKLCWVWDDDINERSFTKLEAKIDNAKGEYYSGDTIDLTNIHAALAKHFGTTDKDYITITADDVLVGGESVREYNGEKIYNYYHLPAYFKEIRDDVAEQGIKLLEIHCLQSSTDGEYAKIGNPTPDKNGRYAWCRCVWEKDGEKHIGAWVFRSASSSVADCADDCAIYCAYGVRDYASFRSAVFGLQD